MKTMILLTQCMDLKAKVSDLSYDMKLVAFLVMTTFVLSLFKLVYFHYNTTHNVKKIKQLLESTRSHWRSGDLTGSRPVSPLPKIERVPTLLSLRKHSGSQSKIQIPAIKQKDEHNSSTDSIRKLNTLRRNSDSDQLKLLKPDSPPSRSHIKSSTLERPETEHRRRKNQIIAADGCATIMC
jgi:hypothetical protein